MGVILAQDVSGLCLRAIRKTFLVGLALMLLSWVADAVLDTAFGDDTFFSEMFHPDLHEIALRSLFMGAQLVFVLYAAYLLEKNRQQSLRLEEALQQLANANQDLEAFNYTVAHDLRQPLHNLSIIWQLIGNLLDAQRPEDCKRYVGDAHSVTLRMNRLIEALLNFSRMGRIELRKEMVDLSKLAHELALSQKQADPGRRVDFLIAEGVVVYGDPDLLRVVLDNLIGNAWKYTGTSEMALIEFGVTEINGLRTYFVRDNGVGFDMAAVKKIFTPFKRLPGAEKQTGFGIGLATVERIIQRHGGKVWAEGELGKGACFYFCLSKE